MLKSKKISARRAAANRGRIARASTAQEHYFRDDIGCGSYACEICSGDDDHKILSETPYQNKLIPRPHYLIPDTNILLNDMDMMEHPHFRDIIVLQTVLEEVFHRSASIHTRVKDLISNRDRRWFLFSNEHRRETFVDRLEDETINDRNDRAIRRCTQWYSNHLSDKGICAVMLSGDRASRNFAQTEHVESYSAPQYATEITEYPDLVDMCASRFRLQLDGSAKVERFDYPELLPRTAAEEGVQSGRFLSGVITMNEINCLEATVNLKDTGERILVKGKKNINRIITGDFVAIKVLPKEEWSAATDRILTDEDDDEIMAEEEKPKTGAPLMKCARVVSILKENRRPYVGTISEDPKTRIRLGQGTSVLLIPIDRRIPKIRFSTTQEEKLEGKRIVVSVDGWPSMARFPQGHFVRIVGEAHETEAEHESVLIEHKVRYEAFTQTVLRDCPSDDWKIPEQEIAKRLDLRHLEVLSIDPPTCVDIDDALHARLLDNGHVEIGVHIADVTYFVKPGTALDSEACKRSTTVYLVTKRIDMIPKVLSTNICSLHEKVDRLAFSVIWELDKDTLQVFDTNFRKTVIHNHQAMSYDKCQAALDNESDNSSVTTALQTLLHVSRKLRQRRMEAGALVLASPEPQFQLDGELYDQIDVISKDATPATQLVEEFMLFANVTVAERIYRCFPDFAILRRHPEPPAENFAELRQSLARFGHSLDTSSSKKLGASLDMIEHEGDPKFNQLVRMLTTRCMRPAEYFCSGTLTSDMFHHYGLAVDHYTHFTSPIRRFADILVHRLLEATLMDDLEERATAVKHMMDKEAQKRICENMNQRHRSAQYAQRASVTFFSEKLFSQQPVMEQCYVTRVMENGVAVLISKFGIEATVRLSEQNGALFNPRANLWKVENLGEVSMFKQFTAKVRTEDIKGLRRRVVVELLPAGLEQGPDVADTKLVATSGTQSHPTTKLSKARANGVSSQEERSKRRRSKKKSSRGIKRTLPKQQSLPH